jgi:predicted ester cyclase
MSQDNKAVLHRIIEEGLNKRNWKVFDELLSANLVDHDLPPGTRGPEGTKAKLGVFVAAFPDLKFTFEQEVIDGDWVAGRGYISGTHKGPFNGVPASGKKVKMGFMDLWRFENGKLAEYWGQPDLLGLLQQIGAVPAPAPAVAAEAR